MGGILFQVVTHNASHVKLHEGSCLEASKDVAEVMQRNGEGCLITLYLRECILLTHYYKVSWMLCTIHRSTELLGHTCMLSCIPPGANFEVQSMVQCRACVGDTLLADCRICWLQEHHAGCLKRTLLWIRESADTWSLFLCKAW